MLRTALLFVRRAVRLVYGELPGPVAVCSPKQGQKASQRPYTPVVHPQHLREHPFLHETLVPVSQLRPMTAAVIDVVSALLSSQTPNDFNNIHPEPPRD